MGEGVWKKRKDKKGTVKKEIAYYFGAWNQTFQVHCYAL